MAISGKIVSLKDGQDLNIFPETAASAVYLENGKTLEESVITYKEATESIVLNNPDMIEKINNMDERLNDLKVINEINILQYRKYVIDEDWSDAIEYLIREHPNGLIRIPSGNFKFSRPIILSGNNSLFLDVNTEIIATKPMDIFIKSHGELTNLTRVEKTPCLIYGYGKINCNGYAKIGVSLGGYRGFVYQGLKMINFLEKGLISKGEGVEYAVELNVRDCYFEIENHLTSINATALDINSTDNHIENIIIVDCAIGVNCSGYSNKIKLVHVWNRDRIQDKDIGYIGINITGQDNLIDTCYGDTCNIAFKFIEGNTFINCDVFNSQYFRASNCIGFDIIGTPSKITTLINCKVKGDSENASIMKAINGTINAFVHLLNCNSGFNVLEGFPYNPSFGAEKFYGTNMDLKGTINVEDINIRNSLNVKNVYSSGKVQASHYEFGSINKKLAVNDNYIMELNDRVIPVYHNYKPTSTSSSGYTGQMYIDQTGLYIYFGSNIGWLMIDRSTLKTF